MEFIKPLILPKPMEEEVKEMCVVVGAGGIINLGLMMMLLFFFVFTWGRGKK